MKLKNQASDTLKGLESKDMVNYVAANKKGIKNKAIAKARASTYSLLYSHVNALSSCLEAMMTRSTTR